MKLNRKWLMVIALVMSLTMATAGTMAYLTDTDADKNTMTLGKVEIVQNEHQRAKDENGDYKTDTIDGKNSYVLEAFKNDKPLLPTTELKADGTPDNHGAGPYDDTTVIMSQIGSYGGVQVFKSPNAQDKIVTVTNTGRTDAYVRTIIAYEVGAATENLPNRSARYTDKNDDLSAPWFRNILGNVVINGNTYLVCEYVYHGAKLSDGTIRHKNGILPAGDTTYPSLMQVYLPAKATNEDVEKLDGNNNGKYDILVLSQAVQADGFDDAATALKAGFGEVNADNVQKWFSEMVIGSPGEKNETNDVPEIKLPTGDDDSVTYEAPADAYEVSTSAELKQAVADGHTVIKLADGAYDVDVAASNELHLYGSKKAVLKLTNEGEDGCDYGFGSAGKGVGKVNFYGLTIDTTGNTGNYKGYAYMGATFNDCSFVGAYSLNNENTFEFNYCDFDFKNGYFWTWGAENVAFNNCTFNGNSKCILAHGTESTQITINNCKFAATEKGYTGAGDNTACVEMDPVGTNTYTINFTGYNTKTDSYSGWTRVKDDSTGHVITGLK